MHFRYANDCIRSVRVPITGIYLLSGIENHGPRPSGLAKLMDCLGLRGKAASK